MPIVCTYHSAKALRDALQALGVKFKPETFSMKTSGIYIPLWFFPEGDSPYELNDDGAGHVAWFFFYRLENGHPDINVEEARLYAQIHGVGALANRINSWPKPFPFPWQVTYKSSARK